MYHQRRIQQKWQKKPLQSISNPMNAKTTSPKNQQCKMMMDIDSDERKSSTTSPYIAQCGNESPSSILSSKTFMFEESKESLHQEMKKKSSEFEEEQKIKDPQDLTYDEITALLGSNTEKNDYLTQLFEEEKNRKNCYSLNNHKNARFLDLRLEVLHSFGSAVKKLKLDGSTGDRALYYFDKLYSMNDCDYDSVHFVAFLCLWISCKYNETANTMPYLKKLINAYPRNKSFKSYDIEDFIGSEKQILSNLKFKLKCVLPNDFIEYYLHCNDNYCCLYPNDKGYDEIKQKSQNMSMAKDMMAYAKFFTDLMNENYALCNKYKPSILAISIICCARKALQISPYLNKDYMFDLFKINKITMEIDECLNKLWSDYVRKFPKQAQAVHDQIIDDNISLIIDMHDMQ